MPPNNQDPRWAILLAGAFGGMLTPILKLALTYTQQAEHEISINLQYWLGALILGLLGLGVTWAFKEVRTQKAVVLGLSLPAFINAAVADFEKAGSESGVASFSLIPSAWAQTSVAPVFNGDYMMVPDRSIELSTGREPTTFSAMAYDRAGKKVATYHIEDEKFFAAPVPDEASRIQFSTTGGLSKLYELSDDTGTATTFEIKIDKVQKFSWLQAFGAKPREDARFEVSKSVISTPEVGTEGWVFLGKRGESSWESLYLSLPDQSIPDTGAESRVDFTLKLRAEPGASSEMKGTLPTGTLLTILETRTNDDLIYWARVRVKEEVESSGDSEKE